MKPRARKAAKANIPPTTYASFLTVHPDNELKEDVRESSVSHRAAVLKTLQGMFKDMLSESECDELEMSIYNGAIRDAQRRHIALSWAHLPFVHVYQMIARRLATNLHPESYVKNSALFQKYKDGEITLSDLSNMSSYDLFETHWKESFEQQQIREKRQLEGDKSMATDQFLCTRCWKRECTYYEMQTRSADEPMTIFINCLNCGKHWRQ